MSRTTNHNFENLFSIATVACVFVIVGTFFTLAKQYPPKFVLLENLKKESKVEGYKRPQKKATPNEVLQSRKDQGQNTVNLLAGLPEQDQQIIQQRFDQAASLLHAGQFEYAITALNQILSIQPRLPEAHVNLGFAFLGLKDYQSSAVSFSRAIDLRPEQLNAYYGLAEALEGMEDYEGALGAMRSYIHLSPPNDPFLAKARAALWEWETKLGRKSSVENEGNRIQFDSSRFVSPHGTPPGSSSPHGSPPQQ